MKQKYGGRDNNIVKESESRKERQKMNVDC